MSRHKRAVRKVKRAGFCDARPGHKPCVRAASKKRPGKCVRPRGKDNEDRNRALNPYYVSGPGRVRESDPCGGDRDKFKFRLRPGTHQIYDDALQPWPREILHTYVALNYGVRERKGPETYVYAFAVQLKPKKPKLYVSGWVKVSDFMPEEQRHLLSRQFKVCPQGPRPRDADCGFVVTKDKPSKEYLERKVAPYELPPRPRPARPGESQRAKCQREKQRRARTKAFNDYKKHRKAGDYFARLGHVNVLVSLPGAGGKSRGTPPVNTEFCKSGERRRVYFYKRYTKQRTGKYMWFVRGYYKTAFGHSVTGWIAEGALAPKPHGPF